MAEAYLEFLYTPAARRSSPSNFYRPLEPEAADPADLARFPKIKLVTIDEVFGGWAKAQAEHFADGGIFDQIYKPTASGDAMSVAASRLAAAVPQAERAARASA